MMKKTFGFILVALTFIFVFCPSVFALDTNTDKAISIVDNGNELIDMRIAQTEKSGNILIDTQASSVAIDNKISNLQMQASNITRKCMDQASGYGVTVEDYYVYVDIAGQQDIPVDPMRVVGP